MKKTSIELFIIVLILLSSFLLFSKIDSLELIVEFSHKYEKYEMDEIIPTLIVLSACLTFFSSRRWSEVNKALKTIQIKNTEIDETRQSLRNLEGIIPICMHCKEIRDDSGAWNQLEKYISEKTEAQFSHGICEKCAEKHYPKFNKKNKNKKS